MGPVGALDAARDVAHRLRDAGHDAFLVGGAVRDLLMGRVPRDLDLVTDARPDAVTRLFQHAHVVGAAFAVVLLPIEDGHLHVATYRREGPYLDGRHPSFVEFASREEDVRRRDFTINALLYDPVDGALVDLVDGQADLTAGRIRAVGDPDARFTEDYLRMLRAVRLAAELAFEIEPSTFAAIGRAAPQIAAVSGERVRDELLRLLGAPGRRRGMELLRQTGLLAVVLPDVAAMEGVEQPPEFHPEGDVWTHTLLALERLRDPSPLLALAVLLHDVGKPPTFQRADRIRFNGHAEVGAEMTARICRRLRLSAEETAHVRALVAEHLRFKDLPSMRPARAKRFLARTDFGDHLELHRVDCLASHGDLSTWTWAREAQAHLSTEERRPPRLVTGDDLLARGYRPGPRFREILDTVLDAQLEGRVGTREQALALVEREFPKENA